MFRAALVVSVFQRAGVARDGAPPLGAGWGRVFSEKAHPLVRCFGRKVSMAEVRGGGCVGGHWVVFILNMGGRGGQGDQRGRGGLAWKKGGNVPSVPRFLWRSCATSIAAPSGEDWSRNRRIGSGRVFVNTKRGCMEPSRSNRSGPRGREVGKRPSGCIPPRSPSARDRGHPTNFSLGMRATRPPNQGASPVLALACRWGTLALLTGGRVPTA